MLYIYNYINIKKLKSNFIVIDYDLGNLCIKGSNLIIKSLYKEYIVIKGDINEISFNKGIYND